MFKLLFLLYLLPLCAFAKPFLIEARHKGEVSYGSGFFINNKGIALTSYHVVENADGITIILDGKKYDGDIAGYDEVLDIAALKVFSVERDFYIVDECLPDNDGYIISVDGEIKAGIIAEDTRSLILRAKVRHGYSGSPFVVAGSACGILTGFHKKTGDAIVAKINANKINDITLGKIFKRKDLQIYITDLTKSEMRSLNLDLKQKPHGILVTYSDNNLLRIWDIITKINGREIYNTDDFLVELGTIYENESTEIFIIRNGISELLTV